MKLWHLAWLLVLLLPQAAPAQEGRLTVELNKLEPTDGDGCSAFFLFRNEMGVNFAAFEMSIAVLNADGVIDRLLSVDAAPLPVARTTLKLFEIPQTACTDISELIVHDIPACQAENEAAMDCYPHIEWVSRAGIRFGQ
ncbi:MAG: hypothetical protein AAGA70_10865 [Pseudomonadota bacterium]